MQPIPAPKIVIGEHTITIEHNGKQEPLDPANFEAIKTRSDAGFLLDGPVDEYFTGDAVKAIKDDGEIGGYLIVWGNETQRDKQGEFFTPQTELRLDYYKTRPILFHHGLADADSIKIGEIYDLKIDNYGVYAKGRLFLNHPNEFVQRYASFAWQETKANKMFWSSGSIAHLVEVSLNGEIKKWPLVEGSLTPTPAEPYRTKVDAIKEAIKSEYPQLAVSEPDDSIEPVAKENTKAKRPIAHKQYSKQTTRKGLKTMLNTQMVEALREKGYDDSQILDFLMTESEINDGADMQQPPPEEPIMAEEPAPEDENPFRSEDEPPPAQPATGKANGATARSDLQATIAALTKSQAAMLNEIKRMKTAPPTEQIPGRTTGKNNKPAPRPRSKWEYLGWQDMLFVKMLLDGASRYQNGQRWIPSDPQDFARELADKIEHEDKYRFGTEAIKSAQAIKTDDVNYSTLTSFGDEFVPDLWRSQLWETPRLDNPVFREMQVIEMPSDPYNIPVEGGDPTIYSVSETADENQLGINDSNAAIPDTQVGTSNTTLASGKLAARIQISAELVEDSIIPVAQHWRFKAVRKMEDARDAVILSADATTGSSNINNSGASISSTSKFLYGGGDGLLHLPLVDNTTVAVDQGGTSPTLAKIRSARTKLNTEILADFGNLVYFCDPITSVALANLDEALNFQINGNESSFNTGMVGRLDSIPVFVTSQMSLALSTGFVSSTAASNTLGRLLLVHVPSWFVGFRRNISVNLAFQPEFDAWTLVVSMRMALQRRSTDVASLLYNIAV